MREQFNNYYSEAHCTKDPAEGTFNLTNKEKETHLYYCSVKITWKRWQGIC